MTSWLNPKLAIDFVPPVPSNPSSANYLWVVLIARIYEVFQLLCPLCGGQMRHIAVLAVRTRIRDASRFQLVPIRILYTSELHAWQRCGVSLVMR